MKHRHPVLAITFVAQQGGIGGNVTKKKKRQKRERQAQEMMDQEKADEFRIPLGTTSALRKFFKKNEELRNSSVRAMFTLEDDHQRARQIIVGCELRGLLRKSRTTKQATFYKAGPKLLDKKGEEG
jgi:hypothetical protein